MNDSTGGAGAPLGDPSLLDAPAVLTALETVAHSGLDSESVAERRERYGRNELERRAPPPVWRRILAQLADPLVYLLLAAIVVSLVAWAIEGAHGAPFDALVVGFVVMVNAVLGYLQEAKAERAVAALQRMVATNVTLLRAGEQIQVAAQEIVPGDILLLREGDAVGADARLVTAQDLRISEASLTGESEPVLKDPTRLAERAALAERRNMIYKGTSVTQGLGTAVVVATGMRTELGRIAHLLEGTREDPTPLEQQLARLGRSLGIAVSVIAVIVVATILLTSRIDSLSELVNIFLLGVSLAVAAVPEGLPAILSVVLALGVQRMARRQAIVRKLSSVETLGSTSVICSDKTGTLTKNEMTIDRLVCASGEVRVTGSGYEPRGALQVDGRDLTPGPLRDEARLLLLAGVLANDARLVEQGGSWSIHGDPTDGAFLVAGRKAGTDTTGIGRYVRVAKFPFTAARKLVSCVVREARQKSPFTLMCKGAPDILIQRCEFEQVGSELRTLTPERRTQIAARIDELSALALRPIGTAYRDLSDNEVAEISAGSSSATFEQELIFIGIATIRDPPRPEASTAISEARGAGVRIIMITGDHPRTAASIAQSIGLANTADAAHTCSGSELERLDPEALRRIVREVSVFARVAPENKLQIVDALQAQGHIVAMTGDGVNDAPALKSADIGIAMGISGTEVSKEAAKIVLADDNFATIIVAIREGRLIFQNIQKFLRYLLSSNLGEVLTMFLGVVGASWLGLAASDGHIVLPLLAPHILWINLLTDMGPALALGVDPAADDVMKSPPRSRNAPVIDRPMQVGILLTGFVMACATLVAVDLQLPGGLFEGSYGIVEARTAAFVTLVLAQLFNCFNARSETLSAFHKPFKNPLLWGAVGTSLALQVLVVQLPLLNRILGTTPLSMGEWVECVALASSVLWMAELRKVIARRSARAERGSSRMVSCDSPRPSPALQSRQH